MLLHDARRKYAALGLIASSWSAIAAAQTPPPAPPANPSTVAGTTAAETGPAEGIAEIVVTARRRAERLQDVPLAVSAFDQRILGEKAATNLIALSNSVPNIRLEPVGLFLSASAFAIRGIGQAGVESHDDPRVALYIDGAYQSRNAVGLGDMFDVEQVEILRGPQGALYGRNAFAGAISIRSRRPGDDFSANGEITVGNYGRRDFSAGVDIPLLPGILVARVTAMHRGFNGFSTIGNPTPSISITDQAALVGRQLDPVIGQSIGGESKNAYRGILKFTPTDTVEANLIVSRTEARNDGSPTINQRLPNSVFGALGFPGRDPFGDQGLGIGGDGTDPFLTGSSYGNRYDIDDWDVLADLTVQVGGGTWFTVVDYKTQASTILTDTDGELVDLFSSDRLEKYHSLQAETRYQHDFLDDRLQVTAGLFWLKDQFDLYQRLQLGFGNPGDPTATPPLAPVPAFHFPIDGRSANNNLQFDGQRRHTISPFAQINYKLTDTVRLTAALRYSYEKKRAYNFPLQQIVGPPGNAGIAKDFDTVNASVTFRNSCGEATTSSKNWSPSLGIDYKPNDDIMVYAQWQRAFKSGGLNVNAQSCATFQTPYNDEQVDNFEVGFKGELFDKRLRLNLTAFWAEYKDLQQSVIRVNPFNSASAETYTSNAAGARIRGVEAEFTLIPADGFNIYGNAGYLDAKYKEFCADLDGPGAFVGTPVSSCGGIAQIVSPGLALIATDNANLRLTRAPKFSGQLGARYTHVMASGSLNFDTSVSHTSTVETQVQNNPFTDRKPLTMIDASLTWTDATERYKIILWGRNINDDVGRLAATYVAPLFIFAYPTQPRTFGATVSFKY
ncbi:TonB-dependent receptor [Sandarakinorhabdus sp. DWP1-3-1]|uniref:TonB-dependent receptor n=1 Tax=Sandarakinorhabdus sp. DWP1-3-1 TaxID=2804627 RepID=UPI003CED0C16